MFSPLIRSALRYPFPFIGISILAVGCAIYSLRGLGFDIWPDVSPVQVQVLTQVRDFAPEEAEATITRPLELEFGGLPGLEETRSETTFGVSQIILVFRPGTNLLQARQWSQERIQTALSRLPKGYSPVLGPPSDGLGEIYTYALQPRGNTGRSVVQELSYLKQTQDFVVRPALRTVPGIVEVNSSGGYDRALVVEPSLEKLYQMGLDAVDLGKAVEASVGVGGGAMLEPGDHQTIV
ncbi:MAG: efflux RND transporter permease subunit, partial [Verrucomicrobia bacterium]|nr:efflux RND transporter permease subunit [Verrucomicrobiota bacterium]